GRPRSPHRRGFHYRRDRGCQSSRDVGCCREGLATGAPRPASWRSRTLLCERDERVAEPGSFLEGVEGVPRNHEPKDTVELVRVEHPQDPSIAKGKQARGVQDAKAGFEEAFQAAHVQPLFNMFGRLRWPIQTLNYEWVSGGDEHVTTGLEGSGS